MGSGRCGSTILGVTLGNCERLFFVGELDRWLPTNGTPVLAGTERTRFWNAVREQLDVDPEMLGSRGRDSLERVLGPLRISKWPGRRRFRRRYRKVTAELYATIAQLADATHLVETSHFPLRARELKAIPSLEIYLVFLVRHPQSMMDSFTKTVGRHDALGRWRRVLKTNADIWLTHATAMWVFLRHPPERRLFMRYEDFTGDPPTVLRQVLDMAQSPAELPDLNRLKTGWPMGGNRLLRAEEVALEAETPKPKRSSRLTAVVQAPLETLMGRLHPAAGASRRQSSTL